MSTPLLLPQLAAYFYSKGHSAHLTRVNHSGLTPADLGLDALLQQYGSKTDGMPTNLKTHDKKDERHRRSSRLTSPLSSPSSSSSSAGLLDEPVENGGGYRDPHSNANIDHPGESTNPRAAAQWRKVWEQARCSDEQEWAEKIADEAAAESGEWGWGGSGQGSTGMGWRDQGNSWEEEEQADVTAREDWMDQVAAEMHRRRAAESEKKRRQHVDDSAAGDHRKQQDGKHRSEDAHSYPRPYNGGAGRGNNERATGNSGIPGRRPGVGCGRDGFAGMRETEGASTGPTKESAAVMNARLQAIRQLDEKRWEDFIDKFGKKVPKHQQNSRVPNQPSLAPATVVPRLVPLKASDIPWPQGMEAASSGSNDMGSNVLSLPLDLSAADVKAAVREAQRRWHPDKFAQRFGDAMRLLIGGETERVRVLEKVKLLAQQINEIPIP